MSYDVARSIHQGEKVMSKILACFTIVVVSLFFGCQNPVLTKNGPTKLVVGSDRAIVDADGFTEVTITAKTTDDKGVLVSSSIGVTFAITSGSGTLSAINVIATNGVATVKFIPSMITSTIVVEATALDLASGSVVINSFSQTPEPRFVSVGNQGMRILNIAFDKDIDISESRFVVNNNKETISSVSIQNKKILPDGKTVQLFLSSGMFNDSLVDCVQISGVKNLAKTATCITSTREFTMVDSSSPTVVSLMALDSRSVKVVLSEAIQGIDKLAFKFDASNSSIASVDYPSEGDYVRVIVHLNTDASPTTHTLQVGAVGPLFSSDYNVTSSGSPSYYPMQPLTYTVTF